MIWLADEVDRLREYADILNTMLRTVKVRISELEAQVARCQEANTEEVERRRKAEFRAVQLSEANDEEVKRRLEILTYLRERCKKTCDILPHVPNCPVADLGLDDQ